MILFIRTFLYQYNTTLIIFNIKKVNCTWTLLETNPTFASRNVSKQSPLKTLDILEQIMKSITQIATSLTSSQTNTPNKMNVNN